MWECPEGAVWIPAFAGMTAKGDSRERLFQSPVPHPMADARGQDQANFMRGDVRSGYVGLAWAMR